MKKINSVLALAGCVAALGFSSGKVSAQGRRNFDPAQMAQYRQDRIDRITEEMDIKDDAEKKAIGDAIGKVMDAQRDLISLRGFGFGRRNRGGGGGGNSTDTQSADNNSNRRQRGGGFGAPSQEEEDLQKAIDDKAPKEELKAKMAALRESRKAKEAKLEETQKDLGKLLDSRQEAIALSNGLVK